MRLNDPTQAQAPAAFDVVIANPPFGRARGEKDSLEASFVRQTALSLRPDGEAVWLVPNGLLSSQRDRALRKWLLDDVGQLRASIGLPSETFVQTGTSVSTGIVVMRRRRPAEDPGNYQVFMAVAESIGWDSRGRPTRSDLPPILAEYRRFVEEGALDTAPGEAARAA